jgi:toxin ParE1/3/4
MVYNCKVSREAEDDIFEAYFWYENQSKSLGEKFLAFFETSLETISKDPAVYRIRYKGLHACPVKQFPYLYVIL